MKKILLALFLLSSFLVEAQSDTSTWLSNNDKGWRYNKFKVRKVFLLPADTVYNKFGLAQIGLSLFTGNGTNWSNITAASTIDWGSITSKPTNFNTVYSTSNDVRDSIQARVRYIDTAGLFANRLKISDTLSMLLNRLKVSDTGFVLEKTIRTFGNQTGIAGNKTFTNNVIANSFATSSGTSSQLLQADGSVQDKSDIHNGAFSFDTTGRLLTIPTLGGGSYSVLIPRGTASGAEGITALTSSRTGNIVSVFGDNGSTTLFSIRDADSSLFVKTTDTAAIVAPYTRVLRFLDSLTAIQGRIQTKQPLGSYLTFGDSSAILAGRWLPNRSADSISVIRALVNTKGVGSVTSITASSPLTGGTITSSGSIGITQAGASADGYLSSTDWNIFNNKVSYTDALARGSLSAGTGISYNSGTGVITNSAPDQTVVLTAGANIGISGTYPSFTITNTSTTVGTVTSVGLTAPTGFTVSGSPITSSGTLGITFTAGYSLPTTASQALWDIAYTKRLSSVALSSSQLTLTLADATTVITSVPTFNQNTTGTAASLSAVLSKTLGGAGDVNGILKANGSGVVSAAVAGTDYVTPGALSSYLPLSGGTMAGHINMGLWNISNATNIAGVSLTTTGSVTTPNITLNGSSGVSAITFNTSGNADIWMANAGTFRIINQAYTFNNFTVNNSGDAYIRGTATLGGALSGTSLSMSSSGYFGAGVSIANGSFLELAGAYTRIVRSGGINFETNSKNWNFLDNGNTTLPTGGNLTVDGTATATNFSLSGRGTGFVYGMPDWRIYNTVSSGLVLNNYSVDALAFSSTGVATFVTNVNAYGYFATSTAGGWDRRYGFKGSSGTDRGGLGAFGADDVLDYYYIGPDYTNYKIRFNNTSGNVGINAIGANAKLEVVAATGEVFRADAASGAPRIVANQSYVYLGGDIGINTFSPESQLHLSKATSGGEGAFIFLDNPATSALGNRAGIRFATNLGATFSGYGSAIEAVNVDAGNGAEALSFLTWNGASRGERFRIGSDGASVFSSSVQMARLDITNNGGGINLNRAATTNYVGTYLQTAGTSSWFIGLRESPANSHYRIYSEALAADVLSLNNTTGAANFSGSVAASAFASSTITLSNSGSGAIQMTGASADIWVNNASGTFRIINQAYTLENFTVSQAGAGFFRAAVTATGFIVSSDLRYKNILSQDGDLYTFTLKADKSNKIHYGYIAQEVEKSMPELVTTDDKGYKAVNYTEVLAYKVRQLEKQIEELKKQNK